ASRGSSRCTVRPARGRRSACIFPARKPVRRARAEHRRRLLAAGLIAWACAGSVQAMPAAAEDQPAATVPAEAAVELYFFWSENCPRCLSARPFVQALGARHGWLTVHDLEVTANPANARLYVSLARSLGQEAHSVPAFVFCGEL